jgi:hypothetical protein
MPQLAGIGKYTSRSLFPIEDDRSSLRLLLMLRQAVRTGSRVTSATSLTGPVISLMLTMKRVLIGDNLCGYDRVCQPFLSCLYIYNVDFFSSSITRTIADYSLAIESFAGRSCCGSINAMPSEFKDFIGFLVVQKIQQPGQLSSSRPTYARYGLKRDRRKL